MKERKSAKANLQNHQHHHNGHLSPFKFAKLFDPDASWDKDQLGDVLHWTRQATALLCGLIWGAIPLVGGFWFMLFLAISSGIIYGYYALVLKVDEEEFGGHGVLLQEGLFASITLFVVSKLSFPVRTQVDYMLTIFVNRLPFSLFGLWYTASYISDPTSHVVDALQSSRKKNFSTLYCLPLPLILAQ